MQELEGPEAETDLNPEVNPDRERKFRIAMGAYGILAVVIWFTVGKGTVFAFGKPVEIRLIPLLVLGTFAFRTWMAREADKIRRCG